MEKTNPNDSDQIWWDKKSINLQMLVALLRFDVDPDTLEKPDWRRRYRAFPKTHAVLLDLFDNHTQKG